MDDSRILSAYQDLPDGAGRLRPPRPARPAAAPLYDACQVGVVLRALVGVTVAVGVVAGFGAATLRDWVESVALISAAAVPGTLAWLVAACAAKGLLARLPAWAQQAAGVALGALAGMAGCLLPAAAGLLRPVPWAASAAAGAALAAVLVGAMVLRAKGRAPADTTARLSELQARIRPHFLFNTLNTAIALVREDPARAEAILEDLSDLFRHALADPGEAVTLDEEVELARRYLEIEQARFGERLRIEWSIDPRASHARVPPLFLQPLVENAVKHGVEPSERGADVKVSTQLRGGTVVIKVTNTVPAGQGLPGHGLAQNNVRDRLALLHDVQAQFRTILKDGVYQVRMEVPA
jgi:two-component system sensor histidine kinase AlgZ